MAKDLKTTEIVAGGIPIATGESSPLGTEAATPGGGAPATEIALTLWGDVWRRLRKNRLAILGLGIIGTQAFAAIFAPLIAPYDPHRQNLGLASYCSGPCPPSLHHWFGTDQLGQDLFSRVVYGARVSLIIGVVAVGIALIIGLTLGAAAGYFGGMIDALVMRVADVFFSFPYILAAIVLIIVIGKGIPSIFLAIGIFAWAVIARLLRASMLSVKENEYVEAARAIGAPSWRIITRHVLPNSLAPVIVYSTIAVGTAILTEAALSFLGIGVNVGTPAWGLMVSDGKNFLTTRPYMIIFPGIAIVITVLGFIFLGDGLRDSMDPRLR